MHARFAEKLIGLAGAEIRRQVPKLYLWGLPAGIAAGWMVFPALPADFKKSIGF
eukprot:gene25494-30779_t